MEMWVRDGERSLEFTLKELPTGNHFQSHSSLLLLLWDKASSVTTHLARFQDETSPWGGLMFLVVKKLLHSWQTLDVCVRIISLRLSAIESQPSPSLAKQALASTAVDVTLTVGVASKDYISAIAALLRLPAEGICWKDSDIFGIFRISNFPLTCKFVFLWAEKKNNVGSCTLVKKKKKKKEKKKHMVFKQIVSNKVWYQYLPPVIIAATLKKTGITLNFDGSNWILQL